MKAVIVGGGLAGCEAAWYLAEKGVYTTLYEMRPVQPSPAHVTGLLGELVCSNSLKSLNLDTAAGLLKEELKLHGSLLMQMARTAQVPAGAALAVDRDMFASEVTRCITDHPLITVIREEVTDIPADIPCILACGPLASESISKKLMKISGGALSFVDAISPVIAADSIDMSKGFFAGRYSKGGDDYLNLPMDKEQFNLFYNALLQADVVKPHEFEDEKVFEKCMPIEVMAARGIKTLVFGPMRPVGLEDPGTGKRSFAVVQLRFENKDKTAYNIVGFQTKMTIASQREVLRLIPGLEQAEFLRYGTIHRNTYINAPLSLTPDLRLKGCENVFMAGQITGVEGYLESMASGITAGIQLYRCLIGVPPLEYDAATAFGALQRHTRGEFGKEYTPGNFHFGMLPPLETRMRKKAERKAAYSARALEIYEQNLISELTAL